MAPSATNHTCPRPLNYAIHMCNLLCLLALLRTPCYRLRLLDLLDLLGVLKHLLELPTQPRMHSGAAQNGGHNVEESGLGGLRVQGANHEHGETIHAETIKPAPGTHVKVDHHEESGRQAQHVATEAALEVLCAESVLHIIAQHERDKDTGDDDVPESLQ